MIYTWMYNNDNNNNLNGKNIIVAIADINTRNFTNKVILELFIVK